MLCVVEEVKLKKHHIFAAFSLCSKSVSRLINQSYRKQPAMKRNWDTYSGAIYSYQSSHRMKKNKVNVFIRWKVLYLWCKKNGLQSQGHIRQIARWNSAGLKGAVGEMNPEFEGTSDDLGARATTTCCLLHCQLCNYLWLKQMLAQWVEKQVALFRLPPWFTGV